MKNRFLSLASVGLLIPALAAAQSSSFGVRGLGLQLRPMSTWALAASGGFGMFERAAHLNPAAISTAGPLTATFSVTQNFRSSKSPFETISGQDNRFPFLGVSGKIRGAPLAVAISFAALHDRSYSIATPFTIS